MRKLRGLLPLALSRYSWFCVCGVVAGAAVTLNVLDLFHLNFGLLD